MCLKYIFSVVLFYNSFVILSQPISLEWVAEYPCYPPFGLEYDRLASDAENNVYLFGLANSSLGWLYGGAILVQKYDSQGAMAWESRVDNLNDDKFIDFEFGPNHSLLIAGNLIGPPIPFSRRGQLAAMDSENGNIRWHTYIFDTVEVSVQLFDIFLGDSNTVYACGAFNDQEEYDSTRAFVAKIDANTGETIWSKILPNMFFANKGIVNGGLLRIFGSQIGYTGNYYLMDIDSNGVVINKALLPVDYFPVGHDPTQFLFDQNGFLITFETGIYKWGINPDPIWGFEFANGQPNIKGKVWDAHADDLGNIYATGHLFMDTLGNEFFPQTIKLSSTGEVLWVSNEKIEENSIYEGGQKISSSDKFVFIFGSKINFNNSFPDYLFEGFSQNGGIIEFDTIIDGNIFDHCDYAHYGQNHFYLLGRSFVPSSTNPDDYRYKLFSFKIEEPSLATAIRGKMPSPTLFPNPSNGIFTVIQNGGTFYDQLTLYSLQGEMIISQQLLSQNQAFNTPNLSPGIYVVKFSGQNGELYKKLVVASNP